MTQPKQNAVTVQPWAFCFDNSYARELDGFYADWLPEKPPSPRLLLLNGELAEELGVDAEALENANSVSIFSGGSVPAGARPIAQAYAGHQFGGFVPQLGDGRALLLGEVIDAAGSRRDIQLKGSGRTPFSRGGDGKAAVGPVLREYIVSEAMHALGVPTTRALAAVATGEEVHRDGPLPGAVFTRVAASHIRVGTFQFFAARGDSDKVRRLADYAIARHYPQVSKSDNRYAEFLKAVVSNQAKLVARWAQVGFVHGVMNTDNTSISGETIDYGPCAFLDAYGSDVVFSSIDRSGRYAFGNQPAIAQWNLARLAETMLDLFGPVAEESTEIATDIINEFPGNYHECWLNGMRKKLGLYSLESGDLEVVTELLAVMEQHSADYTGVFRGLAQAARGDDDALRRLLADPGAIDPWLAKWHLRTQRETTAGEVRAARMDEVNPVYIPRNHKVEEALAAASEGGDLAPMRRLLDVVCRPFELIEGAEAFAEPAADKSCSYRTYCGT